MVELQRVTAVLVADASAFRAGMREAGAAGRQLSADIDRATDEVNRDLARMGDGFEGVANRGTRATRGFADAFRVSGNGAKGFNGVLQQLGFQVGDVATQISMGTNALTAFSVQGSQMLQVFGPAGAIAGAFLAVLGGLAVGFMNTGDEVKTFEDRLKDLQDTLADLEGFEDEISDLDKLREKYGDATQAVIDLINIRRQMKAEEARDQAAAIRGEVLDLTNDTALNIRSDLGIGDGIFGIGMTAGSARFQGALERFRDAQGLEQQAAAAKELRDRLVAAAGSMEEMNGPARELHDKLVDVEQALIDARAATEEIPPHMQEGAKGADDMEAGVARARDRASELTSQIKSATAAMAGFAASAQDQLAQAQLSLQFRDDPVGLARALAERQAGQNVAAAQKAINGDIPSGMREQILAPIKAQGEAAVAAMAERARILKQIESLNAADRSANRGGGRGRSKVDVFGSSVEGFEEELRMLEHRRSLIGQTKLVQASLTAEFERARAVEEVLNEARERGIELSPDQIMEIRNHAAAVRDASVANAQMTDELERQRDAAEEAKRKHEEVARTIAQLSDKFTSAIAEADSFRDALKNIGLELLNLSIQGFAGQGPLGKILGGVFGSVLGGFSSSASGGLTSAFSGGVPVTFSAKGNVFSNGVVTSPTAFPMARGVGMMGEVEPEAVVPLTRGPGGVLGVRATGGGGGGPVVVAPQYHISGLGLSAAEVEAIIQRNNRFIPDMIRDASKRGR